MSKTTSLEMLRSILTKNFFGVLETMDKIQEVDKDILTSEEMREFLKASSHNKNEILVDLLISMADALGMQFQRTYSQGKAIWIALPASRPGRPAGAKNKKPAASQKTLSRALDILGPEKEPASSPIYEAKQSTFWKACAACQSETKHINKGEDTTLCLSCGTEEKKANA